MSRYSGSSPPSKTHTGRFSTLPYMDVRPKLHGDQLAQFRHPEVPTPQNILYRKTEIVSKLHYSVEAPQSTRDFITTVVITAFRIMKGPQSSEHQCVTSKCDTIISNSVGLSTSFSSMYRKSPDDSSSILWHDLHQQTSARHNTPRLRYKFRIQSRM